MLNSSSSAFASFRSAVSKPSVNHSSQFTQVAYNALLVERRNG
jgi:hypothetical protein